MAESYVPTAAEREKLAKTYETQKQQRQKQEQSQKAYDASRTYPETPKDTSDVVKRAKGGSISSASKRADGCAQRGKTKGKMV